MLDVDVHALVAVSAYHCARTPLQWIPVVKVTRVLRPCFVIGAGADLARNFAVIYFCVFKRAF